MIQHHELSTPRDYFRLLLERKVLILFVFALTSAAVIAAANLAPPTYVAKTTLIIKFGREFIYRPEVGTLRDAPTFSLEEMVNSEVEILASRDLAQQVIKELGVDALFPEISRDNPQQDNAMARAIDRFQGSISVKSVLESSIIKVTFEHGNAEVAAVALNLLIEKLKDKHLEIFSDSKSSFLEGQLSKYKQRLSDSENALLAFKEKHGVHQLPEQREVLLADRLRLSKDIAELEIQIADLKQQSTFLEDTRVVSGLQFPEQRKSLESGLHELTMDLRQTEFKVVELERRLALFGERKGETGELVPPHPGIDKFQSLDEAFTRLLDLRIKEEELLGKFNPGTRVVTSLRTEISKVESFLKDRSSQIQKLLEASVQQELDSLKARKTAVAEQVALLRSEIAKLEEHEISLRRQEISSKLVPLEARRDESRKRIFEVDEELKRLDLEKERLRVLERDVTLSESNCRTYLEKSEEAFISEELDKQKITNVRVIERASPPVAASGPSNKMKIGVGLLAGIVAGIAAALFAELMRQ